MQEKEETNTNIKPPEQLPKPKQPATVTTTAMVYPISKRCQRKFITKRSCRNRPEQVLINEAMQIVFMCTACVIAMQKKSGA